MVLVTGATGHFGKAAISFMIKKGVPPDNIIALVRNEAKADEIKAFGVQIRFGNYDDVMSLVKAFQGIEKLMFISGSEVDKREKQHVNIVDAAMEAKVNHIVYTSFHRKDDSKESPITLIAKAHVDTEKYILESGIPFTFLQNALYAEVMPMFIGPKVADTGIIVPAGDGKTPFATRTNMAEAAATVLSEEGHENKYYKTVNAENYSFHDIARIVSELTGKEISYTSPSREEYRAMLLKSGMPEQAIAGVSGFIEGIRQGYFESDRSDLEYLLGRKPDDMRAIIKAFI